MEKKLPRIKALLTPGEVAKRSGVAVSALHFYESKGLITSIRNSGNQRRYKRDVLRYVAIIKIAQRIGIPLATIREAFGVLPEGHTLSAKEWKQLSSQWREELDRRIHTLVALRDELDGCRSMEDTFHSRVVPLNECADGPQPKYGIPLQYEVL